VKPRVYGASANVIDWAWRGALPRSARRRQTLFAPHAPASLFRCHGGIGLLAPRTLRGLRTGLRGGCPHPRHGTRPPSAGFRPAL